MKTKTQILRRTEIKTRKIKQYNLILEPKSDTNWYKSLNHVVKQPPMKFKYNP